jgi:hypothetical protein
MTSTGRLSRARAAMSRRRKKRRKKTHRAYQLDELERAKPSYQRQLELERENH